MSGTVTDLTVNMTANITKGYGSGPWNSLTSVGGIAGRLDGATIEKCTVNGKVVMDEDKHYHMAGAVGGIAGSTSGRSVEIYMCKVTADLTANGSVAYAGGIVGLVCTTTSISKVLVTGDVTASGSCKGGFLWVQDGKSGCDTFCSGRHDANAGGVVGAISGSGVKAYIDNAFVTSTVSGEAGGCIDTGSVIGRCYSEKGYMESCVCAQGSLYENGNLQGDRIIDGGSKSDQRSTFTTPRSVLECAGVVVML